MTQYKCEVCQQEQDEDLGIWNQDPYAFFCSEGCFKKWDLEECQQIIGGIVQRHLDDRDKEWFQIIESILGFHPISMTDALQEGIARAVRNKQVASSDAFYEAACIVEGEPLGYATEEEHKKLENFAERCIGKIIKKAKLTPKEDTIEFAKIKKYVSEGMAKNKEILCKEGSKMFGEKEKSQDNDFKTEFYAYEEVGFPIVDVMDYRDKSYDYECTCECHRNPYVEHCVPCCEVCPYCGISIMLGFMLTHIEECHPEKLEDYLNGRDGERVIHEYRQEIQKSKEENNQKTKEIMVEVLLPAGRVIKIDGIPVELKQDAKALINEKNIKLIGISDPGGSAKW